MKLFSVKGFDLNFVKYIKRILKNFRTKILFLQNIMNHSDVDFCCKRAYLPFFPENGFIDILKSIMLHVTHEFVSHGRVQFGGSFTRNVFAPNASQIFTLWLYCSLMHLELHIIWNLQTLVVHVLLQLSSFFCVSFFNF